MGVAHLKLEAELLGLQCSFNAGEELKFHYNSTPPVVVSLKQALPKDGAHSVGNAICTAISIIAVTPEIDAELCSSLDGHSVKISTLQPATLNLIEAFFIVCVPYPDPLSSFLIGHMD
jgi:hypothetical protein